MAADAERQREIGARIKQLRGRVPQPVIADRVGVTLRAYQAWEAGGGIAWDNLIKLAAVLSEITGTKISESDIIEQHPAEPEPSQLDRIEAAVNAILAQLEPATTEERVAILERGLAEAVEALRQQQEASPGSKASPGRRRPAAGGGAA